MQRALLASGILHYEIWLHAPTRMLFAHQIRRRGQAPTPEGEEVMARWRVFMATCSKWTATAPSAKPCRGSSGWWLRTARTATGNARNDATPRLRFGPRWDWRDARAVRREKDRPIACRSGCKGARERAQCSRKARRRMRESVGTVMLSASSAGPGPVRIGAARAETRRACTRHCRCRSRACAWRPVPPAAP